MDFKQAVITTKYVIEEKSKVVYVSHGKEGWQFFGAEKNITEADARVISLANIINSNPHIKEVLWITEGMEAWMNNEKDGWQTGIAITEE
jgi:hypothetical protein